jgi:hypothetical protein
MRLAGAIANHDETLAFFHPDAESESRVRVCVCIRARSFSEILAEN